MTPGEIAAAALWIAEYEGPYHVDPQDPGGATAYGIALRYHQQDFTDAQLRALTPEGAATFLASRYQPEGANLLPGFVATPLLAFSVLEGPIQAVRALQRAAGVKVDDQIGPATAAAVAALKPKTLLVRFFRACGERLRESDGWIRYGIGWECRQMAASLEALHP